MELTPVEATLIGTALGAAATILASVVTQKATRSRERDHKIWERRADAVEEAHRFNVASASTRHAAVASKQLGSELDPGYQAEQFRMVSTKLALYGSPTWPIPIRRRSWRSRLG